MSARQKQFTPAVYTPCLLVRTFIKQIYTKFCLGVVRSSKMSVPPIGNDNIIKRTDGLYVPGPLVVALDTSPSGTA